MRWKEMAEQLWQSHRPALILLGVLLVLNLLFFAVLEQFVAPRVAEQTSRFLTRQAEVRQLLHNQGGANTPEQAYHLAVEDLEKFRQIIPDYQEFTGLIEELLVLSSRAGMNITKIAYNSSQLKESELLQLDLKFNVAGDYDQIKRFIHSLEQSTRLITIKQIGLQGTNDEGIKLRLDLETYFRSGGRDT